MVIDSKSGYKIACAASIPEGAKTIIIAMHGFCGDKESSCISALEAAVVPKNIGLIKFDWPGHGESEVSGDQLTIENCLKDLDSVVDYLNSRYHQPKLVAFATSFGGYLTLLYCQRSRKVFNRVILRSPAIRMYDVLTSKLLTQDDIAQINQVGFKNFGFERDLKITSRFLADLQNYDINALYSDLSLPEISIIHGTVDDLVSFADSESFANNHGCRLYPVEGADHRYKKPGELDQVIDITLEILKPYYEAE